MDEILVALNEFGEGGGGKTAGVAIDGAGENDGAGGADAIEVIEIHDQAVLRDAAEDAGVTGFAPMEVGKDGFGAGAVGVDDVALGFIAGEVVGRDFAKGVRVEAAVELIHGGMDIGLGGGGTAGGVAAGFGFGGFGGHGIEETYRTGCLGEALRYRSWLTG